MAVGGGFHPVRPTIPPTPLSRHRAQSVACGGAFSKAVGVEITTPHNLFHARDKKINFTIIN